MLGLACTSSKIQQLLSKRALQMGMAKHGKDDGRDKTSAGMQPTDGWMTCRGFCNFHVEPDDYHVDQIKCVACFTQQLQWLRGWNQPVYIEDCEPDEKSPEKR